MTQYFSAFFVGLILVIASNIFKKITLLRKILLVLAALPLSIIAGIRDMSIGTDVTTYGRINYYYATHFSNMWEYIQFIKHMNGIESGYSVLNFWVSRFTESTNVFLFILNFLTLVLVLLGLDRLRYLASVTLGYVVYFGFFWGPSLNVLRQYLAASIVFFALTYLIKNNAYFYAITGILIGSLFHQTALIGLLMVLHWYLVDKCNFNLKKMSGLLLFSSAVALLVLRGQERFESVLANFSLLNKYYLLFLTGGQEYLRTGGSMQYSTLLFRTVPIIFLVLIGIKNRFDDKNFKLAIFFMAIMWLDMAFYFTNLSSGVISRLGLYFSVMRVVYLGFFIRNLKSRGLSLGMTLMFVVYSVYIFYSVTKSGSGQIYPYTSYILENLNIW